MIRGGYIRKTLVRFDITESVDTINSRLDGSRDGA